MYIFIDTETTGLPRNWKAPVSEVENWPRLVQVAWARYDAKNRHLDTTAFIIKPEGFEIPEVAQRVHGITTARALAEGHPLQPVLTALLAAVQAAKIVVAHNLRFDENIIGAECLRQGLELPWPDKRRVCTMLATTEFCCLPGPYGYKWPSLAELHTALFGGELAESHEAAADVATCAKCFFELKKRRLLKTTGKHAGMTARQ